MYACIIHLFIHACIHANPYDWEVWEGGWVGMGGRGGGEEEREDGKREIIVLGC